MSSAPKHEMDRVPGELPRESIDAVINSMKKIVRESAGLEISVERESRVSPVTGDRRTMLVVTLPVGATAEQRAEADYWINEVAPPFRYADEPVRR